MVKVSAGTNNDPRIAIVQIQCRTAAECRRNDQQTTAASARITLALTVASRKSPNRRSPETLSKDNEENIYRPSFWAFLMSASSLATSSSVRSSDFKSNAAAIVSATEPSKNVLIKCESAERLA